MESNRRNFLKMGALATSGLLLSSFPGEAQPQSSEQNFQQPNKDIKMRTLGRGKTALEVSAIGLGCLGMSASRSIKPDKKEMVKVIRNCYDLGYKLFDTAELYGPFTNEELVGEAVKPFRKNVIVTTKFGFKNAQTADGYDSTPKTIKRVIDESLKRLQTDYVDMFYQHRVDPNVPMEDVAGTVGDLIKQGKVRFFGMSEADETSIRKAHAVTPLTALQNEYSAMIRESENRFALCEELGIGLVAYSSLCRGYLTGMINERVKLNPNNDTRHLLPHFEPKNIVHNWKIIDVLQKFGDNRGLTIAQVALAWVLAQKPFIVPIPGTSKTAHAFGNLQAMDYQFSGNELKVLTDEILAVNIIARKG